MVRDGDESPAAHTSSYEHPQPFRWMTPSSDVRRENSAFAASQTRAWRESRMEKLAHEWNG